MGYQPNDVKKDANILDQDAFFQKYFCSDYNWYIEEYLGHGTADSSRIVRQYKAIVAAGLGSHRDYVFMTGSAKLGFSLSPPKPDKPSKLFQPFNDDESVRKVSDLDITVVSESIFVEYWDLYRKSYKQLYESTYKEHIYNEIYRGFINEDNVKEIDGCRTKWNKRIAPIRASLKKELLFRHEVNFRIYRNIGDYKDYTKKIYWMLKKGDY